MRHGHNSLTTFEVSCCKIINGLASKYFNLERELRQGHPLSPFLFLVAIETLAIVIRKNVDIKGFIFGNEETKALQYADDTITVLADHSTCGHKLGY